MKSRTYSLWRVGGLALCLLALVASWGCSEDPNGPSRNGTMYSFSPAPFKASNPFDSVGVLHTAILQVAFDESLLTPSDTADMSTLLDAIRQNVSGLNNINMESYDDGVDAVQSTENTDWSEYLANYSNANLTSRELNYIHRIGEVFHSVSDSSIIKDSLLTIEQDIVDESWPAGDTTEIWARVVISVSKHSYYWWNWFYNPTDQTHFNKLATDEMKGGKTAAADAGAALGTIISKTISGTSYDFGDIAGAMAGASVVAAVSEFWDEISSFLEDCWDGIKSVGSWLWPF